MVAITVLAFGLRLVGIGFLLPHRIEPDGHVLEDEVLFLESDDHDTKRPHPDGLYPHLLPRLATLAPIFPERDAQPSARSLEEHRSIASRSKRNLRILVALLSVLVVPATWLLARRFLSGAWALVPPGLMAVSVLHIWFTQQMRPHGPAAVLMILSLLAAFRLRQKPGFASLVLCGACAGLSVACLQSGLAVLPAFLAAFLVRRRDVQESNARLFAGAAVGGVCVAACIWLFYPFLFETVDDGRLALAGDKFQLSGHNVMLASFNGKGFPALLRAAWGYEPLMLVLASLGATLCIGRVLQRRPVGDRRGDVIVLLAFVIPYCLVIGMYEFSYQRFLLPLLPPAACLVAYVLQRAARPIEAAITQPVPRKLAVATLVAIPFGLESFAAARLLAIRAQPDTITEAADWVGANTRPALDRILVLPTLDLPLFPTQASLAAQREFFHDNNGFPWFAYLETLQPQECTGARSEIVLMPISKDSDRQRIHDDCAGYFADLHGDYAVIPTGFEGWGRLVYVELREELARSAVLEAIFCPDQEGYWGAQVLGFQEDEFRPWVAWTWRVLHARCTGPRIEIYRLRN